VFQNTDGGFIVQDYELQLMTYRAFVESMHKSPVKRRRMHSSSDAITQEVRNISIMSACARFPEVLSHNRK